MHSFEVHWNESACRKSDRLVEGRLSALYVITEVYPTHPCTCLIHNTPPTHHHPDIQPLSPPSSIQPPFPPSLGLGPRRWWSLLLFLPTLLLRVLRQGSQWRRERSRRGIFILQLLQIWFRIWNLVHRIKKYIHRDRGCFFHTMIWNTKQRNLRDDKKNEKRQWPVSYHHYTPCVDSCVYPPPPLEGFIGDGCGYACLDAQPNSPHIYQTPLPVYHSSSDEPVESL